MQALLLFLLFGSFIVAGVILSLAGGVVIAVCVVVATLAFAIMQLLATCLEALRNLWLAPVKRKFKKKS